MNLTRVYHGRDERNRPYTMTLNQLRVTFEPGTWSECSACGDSPGEQQRQSDCRVKFSFPRGEPSPDWREFYGSDILDGYERERLLIAVFKPYSLLMEQYDETMSEEAIR